MNTFAASRLVITNTRVDGLAVLHLQGDIDLSNARSIADAVADLAAWGHRRIGIDLSDVLFMGSTALKVLSEVEAFLRTQGGGLVITAASLTVRRVFRVVGLGGLLPPEGVVCTCQPRRN